MVANACGRVTLLAAGTATERALTASVNVDAGAGPLSSSIHDGGGTEAIPGKFVVSAVAEGLPVVHLSVPLSAHPRDSPLSVAAASVALADIGE